MSYDIVMPQLGMTMTEGSVLQWLKQPGERIEMGEPLFEVHTDKVDMEVEALSSGFLEQVLVELGKVVPVGTVIARISPTEPSATRPVLTRQEEPSGMMRAGSEPSLLEAQEEAPISPGELAREQTGKERTLSQKLVSPRAKRIAQELGVDLSLVEASKGRGRVTEADVRQCFERLRSTAAPTAPIAAVEVSEIPSAARKAIAARMTQSVQTVPHFYLGVLADATELKKFRESLLPVVERQSGVRLTYTDLLIKALALALRENSVVNSSWQDEKIVWHDRVNIGFAAQIGEALIVPVVREADQLTLPQLARVRNDLVERARAGKLKPVDLEGASCTLSNLGAFGIDQFNAIINPPQSAILAVGKIAPQPVVIDEQVTARTTVSLTLSLDHRVVDGVPGAVFLRSIVNAIESPYRLLLNIS